MAEVGVVFRFVPLDEADQLVAVEDAVVRGAGFWRRRPVVVGILPPLHDVRVQVNCPQTGVMIGRDGGEEHPRAA